MPREKHKWKPHKCQSTDAEHRGGATRSSDEDSVMGLERRGSIVQLELKKTTGNGRIGLKQAKPFWRLDDRSRMSGDVHVRFCEHLRGRLPRVTRLVCAFQCDKDAQRFYRALIQRLARFGLEAAEDKTQIIAFSHCKARAKTKFDFLGFEFRWSVGRSRKPLLKRRTSRNKLRASLANFKAWFQKHSRLPKKILFAKLTRKLLGYHSYYGVTGNYQSLNSFVYQLKGLFFKWLNGRSQRKSYNWKGFKELVKGFEIAKPRILHAL
jgi:hypothetical protein